MRYSYIQEMILRIYRSLPEIVFPLNPLIIFNMMTNCRVIPYGEFAYKSKKTINDIILMCESNSGCTYYNKTKKQYLVLYNNCCADNNVAGRIRWTQCHELGHIVLSHFLITDKIKIAEHGYSDNIDQLLEQEADYFTARMLAPFISFDFCDICSSEDIIRVYGLSRKASEIAFRNYQLWQMKSYSTTWENRMLDILKCKPITRH